MRSTSTERAMETASPCPSRGRARRARRTGVATWVDPAEAEEVVREAKRPFPRRIGEEKLLVWGPGRGGRLLQVIFVVDEDGTAFVIHGRELTKREKGLHRGKGR